MNDGQAGSRSTGECGREILFYGLAEEGCEVVDDAANMNLTQDSACLIGNTNNVCACTDFNPLSCGQRIKIRHYLVKERLICFLVPWTQLAATPPTAGSAPTMSMMATKMASPIR